MLNKYSVLIGIALSLGVTASAVDQEALGGFLYGLITRAIGSKTGFYVNSQGFTLLAENSTETNALQPRQEKYFVDHLKETGELVMGFNTGVVLWLAAYFLYMMKMNPVLYKELDKVPKPADMTILRDTVLTAAHQSGMDMWVAYRAFVVLAAAFLTVLTSGQDWASHFFSSVSFLVAFAINWFSFFWLGEGVANKVAKKIGGGRLTETLLIFTIGIGLTDIIRRMIFDMAALFEECAGCHDFYVAGDELAYVFGGVIPNYKLLDEWIQLFKARSHAHLA